MRFNPCFNGSCSRIFCSRGFKIAYSVSILVLVDLAHEFLLIFRIISQHPCFNPCFSGSCSRMFSVHGMQGIVSCFNPCFSGSCSRIRYRGIRCLTSIYGFNPCFSGSCSRICAVSGVCSFNIGFNPCFSGSCSRIRISFPCPPVHTFVSILVLVDLAHESKLKARMMQRARCFNPCFSGSCSRIGLFSVQLRALRKFQSLF